MDEGRRLYVGGLPRIAQQRAVDAEMLQLFTGFRLEAVSKIISPHESKRNVPGSHYYCFVDLPTAEDAQAAVQKLDGTVTRYGGTYKVNLSTWRRPTKMHREQLGGAFHGEVIPYWRRTEVNKPMVGRDLEGNWRCVK